MRAPNIRREKKQAIRPGDRRALLRHGRPADHERHGGRREKHEAKARCQTVLANRRPKEEVVAEESEKATAMMCGGHCRLQTLRGPQIQPHVTQLATASKGTRTIVDALEPTSENAATPLVILVPVWDVSSRRAAEFRSAMARATQATGDALYVTPPKQELAKPASSDGPTGV